MKIMLKPEFELIGFDTKDIIATSGGEIPLGDKAEVTAAPQSAANSENWKGVAWNNGYPKKL